MKKTAALLAALAGIAFLFLFLNSTNNQEKTEAADFEIVAENLTIPK